MRAAKDAAGMTRAASGSGSVAIAAVAAAPAPARAPSKAAATDATRRLEARMKGYEGESCSECGNFTMVRNGTCLKCDTCGSTSGCS